MTDKPKKNHNTQVIIKQQRDLKISQTKEGRAIQQAYAETLTKTLGHLVDAEELEKIKAALDPQGLRFMTDEQIIDKYTTEYPDSLIDDKLAERKQKLEKIKVEKDSE